MDRLSVVELWFGVSKGVSGVALFRQDFPLLVAALVLGYSPVLVYQAVQCVQWARGRDWGGPSLDWRARALALAVFTLGVTLAAGAMLVSPLDLRASAVMVLLVALIGVVAIGRRKPSNLAT